MRNTRRQQMLEDIKNRNANKLNMEDTNKANVVSEYTDECKHERSECVNADINHDPLVINNDIAIKDNSDVTTIVTKTRTLDHSKAISEAKKGVRTTSKYTEDQIERVCKEIKELKDNGLSSAAIYNYYRKNNSEVHVDTIKNIVQGRRWKDISEKYFK